jgi:Rrf2 family protein
MECIMRANSQFAIAIHVLTLLALSDAALSSADIAGSAGTNPVFVRRIIGDLQRAGLVETHMGVNGGVTLARDAGEISLLDAYDATHQGHLLSLHQSQPLKTCLCGGSIKAALSPIFTDAEGALRERLAQYTITDVAQAIRMRAGSTPSPETL